MSTAPRASPFPKRKKRSSTTTATFPAGNSPDSATPPPEKPKPTTPKTQSNRVFTEKDEIRLLKALLRASRSTKPSPTPLSSLIDGQFSHNQITNKLRRLRERYHKLARTKSLIKTPHDQRFYEIGRKIWGKKTPNPSSENRNPVTAKDNGAPQEVGLEDFPALMEEASRILPENEVYREGLLCLERSKLKGLNERWVVQRMEEAGLLAKRAQLNYEQSKLDAEAVLGI